MGHNCTGFEKTFTPKEDVVPSNKQIEEALKTLIAETGVSVSEEGKTNILRLVGIITDLPQAVAAKTLVRAAYMLAEAEEGRHMFIQSVEKQLLADHKAMKGSVRKLVPLNALRLPPKLVGMLTAQGIKNLGDLLQVGSADVFKIIDAKVSRLPVREAYRKHLFRLLVDMYLSSEWGTVDDPPKK